MTLQRWLQLATVLASVSAASGQGAIRMAAPFGEHMVLQQGMPIPVWGDGCPGGESVTVAFAGQTVRTTSDWQGRWLVRLAPVQAGGPYQMLVSIGAGPGPYVPSAAANDHGGVELNDVLVGEVWFIAGTSSARLGTNEVMAPWVRMLKPSQKTGRGQWVLAKPAALVGRSQTSFYFGQDLRNQLKTPVGLIDVSFAGSPADAWDQMIAPIKPYALRGAVWLEGDAEPQSGEALDRMFQKWRQAWGQGDFPLIYAPTIGQTNALLQPAATATAVTSDLNPGDQQELARRLAAKARALASHD
jgi:hypothetical protein